VALDPKAFKTDTTSEVSLIISYSHKQPYTCTPDNPYLILFLCSESYSAAKEVNQLGHVPMLVWHDEADSFDCNGSIPGISVINSLSKTFPTTGKWAGGMILRLYCGIGFGIAFTKKQVKKLLNDNTFEHATRMYESPSSVVCTSQLPHRQRREAQSIKLQTAHNQQQKRKADCLRSKSHNVAHIERVKRSHEFYSKKRKKRTVKKKITFSVASKMVTKHAKSPSMVCTPCIDNDFHSDTGGFVGVNEDFQKFYTLDSQGVVESWDGPLLMYDMTGWRSVKGGFIRPRPECPSQGMAIREVTVKFDWLPGMKDFVREKLLHHTASSAPYESIATAVSMDGRWSDLSCPTKLQIKNFAMSHFSKKKKDAQHALDRQGKRCYTSFSLIWLKKEVSHRGLRVGNRKRAGCIKLLENHDDDNESNLVKYHSDKDADRAITDSRLTFSAFKKGIQSRPVTVPWIEWYQKECVYQDIEISSRLREQGMCKLLHKHYLVQDDIVYRHDDDHTVDEVPEHTLGDKVEVFWHHKWYPATVIKVYPNNTWDVEYPPPADQVYWSRLPSGLLRKTSSSDT